MKTSHEKYSIPQARFYSNPDKIFDIYLPEELHPIINKIRNGSEALGGICHIKQGLIAKPKNKYVIPSEKFRSLEKATREHCRKVVDAGDVKRFVVAWSGGYIVYGKTLHRARKKEIFEREKLMVPRIARRLQAAYDAESFYCLERVYLIYLREEENLNLKYILALLNSELLDFYYMTQFSPTHLSGGYLKYYKAYLEQIPIKRKIRPEIVLRLTELVDEVIARILDVIHTKARLACFPESYLKKDITFDKLLNVVRTKPNLTKNRYRLTEKARLSFFRDLDSNMVFRTHLSDKEYLDFRTEGYARYVAELLNTRQEITKGDILRLSIPSISDLKELLKWLEGDKRLVDERKEDIADIEKRMNDLIYDVYGLDGEEKLLVREYIKKTSRSTELT